MSVHTRHETLRLFIKKLLAILDCPLRGAEFLQDEQDSATWPSSLIIIMSETCCAPAARLFHSDTINIEDIENR